MYEIWQAIILGLVQGLTEFIPVSSSAHLIIAEFFLGSGFSSLAYDVVLHLGTLLSLLVYFRQDLLRFAQALSRPSSDRKLLIYLAVATLPAMVVGFYLQETVETALRSLWVIVVMLVAVSALMFVADRRHGRRRLEDITLKDAIIIGLAQALSLIPGTSRAGSTIVAGSLLGFNNAESARFSFYMAIPILLGANLRVLTTAGVWDEITASWLPYVVGFVVAAVIGYFVIRFLLSYLSTHKLAVFAWYRLALALILVFVLI